MMADIANAVRIANRPLSTALLVERVGGSSAKVSALCCELRDRGWLRHELRKGLGTATRQAWWFATPKLLSAPYKAQPKVENVQERINAALDAGITDRAGITAFTKLPPSSLTYAFDNMIRQGTLERIGPGQYARPLDDDGWTPQPYIHPYRAKALGLTR